MFSEKIPILNSFMTINRFFCIKNESAIQISLLETLRRLLEHVFPLNRKKNTKYLQTSGATMRCIFKIRIQCYSLTYEPLRLKQLNIQNGGL